MEDKRIVVIFPGRNYSADKPLLYYAGFKFEVRGYEKLVIDYGDIAIKADSLSEFMDNIKDSILIQLDEINISDYNDIVFVSKSIGTIVAGWSDEMLGKKAKHIYLTPVTETLPYIKRNKNIITVIAGTDDKQLDSGILNEHCLREGIDLKLINGVGHNLEVWGDMNKNIEILKDIISVY